MHRKRLGRRLGRLALVPLFSLLPLAFVAGAVATAIEALLRVRRLERRVGGAAAA